MLLGAGAVGKTSLINRYVKNRFSADYKITLGADFLSKKVSVTKDSGEIVEVNLLIWDIAGQSQFSSFKKFYFQGVHGSLLVFDLSREETLNPIQKWNEDVLEYSPNAVNVLIGNKSDLTRNVSEKNIQKLGRKLKSKGFVETSAKTGEKVNEAFLSIIKSVLAIKDKQ